MALTRSLPLIVALGLIVFSLVECLTANGHSIRHLPKPVWLMLIVLVPVVGAVGWLLFGRPQHHHHRHAGPPAEPQHRRRSHPIGPDDDPDFLRELGRAAERRRDEDGESGART